MKASKYADLPDSLPPEEIHALFRQLLTIGKPKNREEALEIAEAMDEVADRQWHTYTLLDDETRQSMDEWVVSNWDRNSLMMVRRLISIIAKLGLVRSADMMRRELDCVLSPEVRCEISDALAEFGSTVYDPYSGMRNSQNLGRSHIT